VPKIPSYKIILSYADSPIIDIVIVQ